MKKTSASVKLLLFSGSLLLAAGCACDKPAECKAAKVQEAPESAIWPDRAWLVDSVVKGVPSLLSSYDHKTGEFGEKPWICQDQNQMFSLAVAWATPDKNNPYYHSPELLKVIAKAGEKLVDAQDAKGMWTFRKKDNSTWGQIHMPWTFTRWIRTYNLVKDALPPASKAKWEKGLLLGYKYIAGYCSGTGTHNITVYHAAGLYVAGLAFNKPEWCKISQKLMHLLVSRQAKDGFWTENHGPVVSYNFVYLEALGIYYHYSKDPVALEALTRGAQFHNAVLWPDGSAVSVVDERNYYSRTRRVGNVGFTCSPEGRRYLAQQLEQSYRKRRPINMELAAHLLLEGVTGELAPKPGETSSYLSKDGQFLVARSAPYQWALSAYSCKVPRSRWMMDRQTHVEIGHDRMGVIGSGGNAKMQPYYSTFTFGDPDSFQPDLTKTDPDFYPKSNLRYVPDHAKITGNTVALTYGKNQCQVTVIPGKDMITLEYKLNNAPDAPAMAHFPVVIPAEATDAKGNPLAANKIHTGKALGGKLIFSNGQIITIPDTAQVRPEVVGFNPYEKYGKGGGARLVISLPLTAKDPVQKLVFSGKSKVADVLDAPYFAAADLPVECKGGATFKFLDELDAIFLRATAPGPEMVTTVTLEKPFKGELLVDLARCYTYGKVQVLVNGKAIGKPVNGYNKAIAVVPPTSVGEVTLPAGKNTITFRVTGKDPASQNYFIGLRGFYLKNTQK